MGEMQENADCDDGHYQVRVLESTAHSLEEMLSVY